MLPGLWLQLNGLDRNARLIKGLPWLLEGQTWQGLWDEDFDTTA